MHARLILLGVIAVAGCTQMNPAFGDGTGTDGETSSTMTTASTTGVVDEGEGPLMCDLEGGDPVVIKMAMLCRQENFELYDRWFTVVEAVDSSWEVNACELPNCGGCVDSDGPPLFLGFSPLKVANLASPGTCLRVTAGRRYPDNPDSCEYHTVVVQDFTQSNTGVPILIARNDPDVAMPTIDVASGVTLAGFKPQLELVEQCSCDAYPGDCCDGVGPGPAVYDFGVGLPNTVPINGKETLVFDGAEYEFWAYDAFQTGECGEPLHVSWAMTLK